jgi:hypothetical protein
VNEEAAFCCGSMEALAPFAFSVHLKDQALQSYEDGFLLGDIPLGQGSFDLTRTPSESPLKESRQTVNNRSIFSPETVCASRQNPSRSRFRAFIHLCILSQSKLAHRPVLQITNVARPQT